MEDCWRGTAAPGAAGALESLNMEDTDDLRAGLVAVGPG